MLHIKYLRSGLSVLDKIFKVFPYTALRKTGDPRGGVNFDNRGIIWTIFKEDYLPMKQTNNRSSRHVLEKQIFKVKKILLLVFKASKVLHGINFFERIWKKVMQWSFLPS